MPEWFHHSPDKLTLKGEDKPSENLRGRSAEIWRCTVAYVPLERHCKNAAIQDALSEFNGPKSA